MVRPEEHQDLSADAWAALGEFEAMLRDRAHAGSGLTARLRRRLGIGSDDRFETVVVDLFADVDLSAAAADTIDDARDTAIDDADDALETLHEAFGGTCHRTYPEAKSTGTERVSRCVRATPDYEDAAAVIEARLANDTSIRR